MKKSAVEKYSPDSAEYVVMHAKYQKSKGHNPSIRFHTFTNKKALKRALVASYFPINDHYLQYNDMTSYVCSRCGATHCKLWRRYQDATNELLCVICSTVDQKINTGGVDAQGNFFDRYLMKHTHNIGLYLPAVPKETENEYWGVLTTPDVCLNWWRELPTFA